MRLVLLLALFVVSAASLAFEVMASRAAATYLGATAYVNGLLLSVFLGGIGAGGWAASWLGADRARLARHASWLLSLAGIHTVLLAPALTALADAGPAGLVPRGALFGLLVLPVGLGVGFAYPAVTVVTAPAKGLGRGAAVTYAADTTGAAVGALLAGFVLVPGLGLRATGVASGAALAACGLILRRHATGAAAPAPTARNDRRDSRAGPNARWLLGVFFATGMAALALEVAWIRLFTLIIGTSIFSFSLTVAAFLAALGLGSHLVRGRVEQVQRPATALARILLLVGAIAPLLPLLAPAWERIYMAAHQSAGSRTIFLLLLSGLALASILLPAGLMGAGFGLGIRLIAQATSGSAAAVGRLYGVNTLGGVVGALLAGLVVMPAWGVRTTLLLSAAVYVIAGAALLLRSGERSGLARNASLALAGGGVMAAVLALPEPGLFFAPYYHGLRLGGFSEFAATRERERLLYRRFSPYGLVTVSEDNEFRYLRHNGKAEASTVPGDMSTQLLIAHLPLMLHDAPERVTNIGLGAGFTLGALTQHPGVRAIVQAEIDPRVVEAARIHFAELTGRAMEDPRVATRVTDGRRLLASDAALYDVVVSEPSNLWVSGVSGLFTEEFYGLVVRRLAAGGIFATWVPRYEMGPKDVQIVAATLLAHFAHVTAFENGPADIIFLASPVPFRPSLERVRAGLAAPGVRRDIERALTGFPLTPESLTGLLEQVAANAEAMRGAVPPGTPLNTDDRPVLEFHTALAAIGKRPLATEDSP